MCGKVGPKTKMFALGGFSPTGLAAGWQGLSDDTKNKYMDTYAGLHYVGAGNIRKYGGVDKYNEKQEKLAEQEQQSYLDMQYAPLAPDKTAMEIGAPQEIRDKRRQAALMGINQLRTLSGPGVGTGSPGTGTYYGVGGGLS